MELNAITEGLHGTQANGLRPQETAQSSSSTPSEGAGCRGGLALGATLMLPPLPDAVHGTNTRDT